MNKCMHVAIIMDGNGRWAKAKNQPRTKGHLAGTDNVRNIAIAANDRGIEVLTVYAFSSENWKREKSEVDYLMKLPFIFFNKFIKELMEKNIRISMIGERSKIPSDTMKVLDRAIEETKNNTGMVLNFAMNYGAKNEIIHAINKSYQYALKNNLDCIDEALFESNLYTKDFPDVDLVIRTSGEQRISNFLLWQIAYSELMFVDESWPDFTEKIFNKCIDAYEKRDRRFGGIK